MYLFEMKSGKKKLVYGQSPEDALRIFEMRSTPEEMEQIIRDQYVKIHQRQLQEYVHLLG
jgi:hypothetical protein